MSHSPPPPGARRGPNMRKVLDAEIVAPESGGRDYGQPRGRRFIYGNTGPEGFWHGPNAVFTSVFSSSPAGGQACAGPAVSFVLFLICLFGYGFLAGLGFIFFLTIGSVIGSWRNMQRLLAGQETNPWLWRAGNWAVSFFLTVWLAGGGR